MGQPGLAAPHSGKPQTEGYWPYSVAANSPKRERESVKNWLPGGPADETVCPTFLGVQGFANWVGQAVSPAGPILHTF